MSDIEILKKLVKKVEATGYKVSFGLTTPEQVLQYKIYYRYIFDHGFAKALWGDNFIDIHTGKKLTMNEEGKVILNMYSSKYEPEYVIRLKEMVQTPDYLKFLSKFV